MVESATTLALIGIVGAVITALFKLLQANTKALGSLVESTDKVAKEARETRRVQEKGFGEAEKRNGHLEEQTTIITKSITIIPFTTKTITKIAIAETPLAS